MRDIASGFSAEYRTHNKVYMVHYCHYYGALSWLRSLMPIADIQQAIDNRKSDLFSSDIIIGPHIRSTDNIGSKNSPLSLFIEKIEEELLRDSSIYFYVASDDKYEKSKLKNLFEDMIIYIMDEVMRDNEKVIADAIVELYTLSSVKKIYGSVASTLFYVGCRFVWY